MITGYTILYAILLIVNFICCAAMGKVIAMDLNPRLPFRKIWYEYAFTAFLVLWSGWLSYQLVTAK